MLENGVLLQAFHWYTTNDGSHWQTLAKLAPQFREAGFTALWLPPACKGAGGVNDTGYGVYDLFDLGEFDQKGATRTKYGTKAEYLQAVTAAKACGLQVYADLVFNQKCGADECEMVDVLEVDANNRNVIKSATYTIKAWTKFNFAARGDTYSSFKWNKSHFKSVDFNADAPSERKIYLFAGKTFSGEVSFELGNFDHLMGCNIDEYVEPVRNQLFAYGRWLVNTTKVDGFRLDAVKHIPASFYKDFFHHVRDEFEGRELLGIGEFWSGNVDELQAYLARSEGVMKLFDVPLHFKLQAAAKGGAAFNLTEIFAGTLVAANPSMAVTFVDNHDTQLGQSLASPVDDWFKPLAYALVLLRQGGYPTVFYADYFGSETEPKCLSHRFLLDRMLDARRRFNFGDQHDHFDHPNCIAWVRTGDAEHPGSMVVIMSNGDGGRKRVNAFAKDCQFRDVTGHCPEPVKTDGDGFAEFYCPAGKVSVWVQGK